MKKPSRKQQQRAQKRAIKGHKIATKKLNKSCKEADSEETLKLKKALKTHQSSEAALKKKSKKLKQADSE